MEEKLKKLQCSGCGSDIQSAHPQKVGYLEEKSLNKLLENNRPLLCRRCFRLLHYKEVTPLQIEAKDFEKVINKIPSKVSIVAVTDIFDLTVEFFSLLKQLPKSDEIIIVVNKIEDLPRDYKIAAVLDWIRKQAKKEQINLLYIVPVSAKTKYNIDLLYQILSQEIKSDEVYFIGNANVGKSSLINALIKSQSRAFTEPAISLLPGTTLNFLSFKNGHQNWYDTPGLLLKNQELPFLKLKDWESILPNSRLKPRTFQVFSGQTMFIGGLGWIEFLSGPKTSFIFYFNSQVTIHRRKTGSEVTNLEFYERQLGKILVPPREGNLSIGKFIFNKTTVKIREKTDFVIPAIGWVSINPGLELQIVTLEDLSGSLRIAIV